MPKKNFFILNHKMELLLLSSILMWGIIIRLWDINRPFIGDYAWNEVYYAYIARSFFEQSVLLQYDIFESKQVNSFPLVPWLIYGSFYNFGNVEWAARLPMLVFGLIALIFLFFLTSLLYDNYTALLATFLASTAPGIVFFSRNVLLDGVMTTLGLGALLTLVLFQSNKKTIWVVISFVMFTLAILAKYTAILFWPALAWSWHNNTNSWREKKHWLGLIIYTTCALAPSIIWILISLSTTTEQASSSEYFLRFNQWTIENFKAALLSLWPNAIHHLGSIIFYPTLLLIPVIVMKMGMLEIARNHIIPILIIIPWYLQIGYPRAWVVNEYYQYPALYAMCMLIAVIAISLFKQVINFLDFRFRQSLILVCVCAGFVLFSNFLDYRTFYHSTFYPWPLINQSNPFLSARKVASLDLENSPVLTDLTVTFYYTEADSRYGKQIWWGAEAEADIIEAIQSRGFEYIVFTYPPTIDIIQAINSSGYERLEESAWKRTSN